MRCRKAKVQIGAYLYGDLKASGKSRLERHLEGCRKCTEEMEKLRTAMRLLPEESVEFPPSSEWEKFGDRMLAHALSVERLLSIKRGASFRYRWQKALAPAFAAIAVVFAFLFVFKNTIVTPAKEYMVASSYVDPSDLGELEEGDADVSFLSTIETDEDSTEALFGEMDLLGREIESITAGNPLQGGIS